MVDTVKIWSLLEQVNDPEVPVLSVVDLGIIREVKEAAPGEMGPAAGETIPEIVLTPTYSGCPAMDAIRMNIRMVLLSNGYRDVRLTTVLSPAWTTEWMSEKGKDKLKAYGIAPPDPAATATCPRCGSPETQEVSRFGSTPCKAQWRCTACHEPFDRFKCH